MIERAQVEGRWVHSREEDTDDEMVFRAAGSGYAFPPSRGREALELRPDDSYAGTAPGPADKPQVAGVGHWKLENGERLVLPGRTLEITAADADVLRVRKR